MRTRWVLVLVLQQQQQQPAQAAPTPQELADYERRKARAEWEAQQAHERRKTLEAERRQVSWSLLFCLVPAAVLVGA